MAAAYKTIERRQNDFDSSSDDDDVSEDSSETLRRESSSPEKGAKDTPALLKNRTLMLTSRGVSHRHRHLLNDLSALLPNTYKDTKLDTKSSNNYNSALNGLAELHSCNYVFFLEARKHGQDLYLWLAKAPNGPTIKFSVNNVHTMGELGFGGNCLKGGRGIVAFDKSFEQGSAGGVGHEYRGLVKEMLSGVFCVPAKGVRGMKPFIDRIIGVFELDNKIWIRVYEIRETDKDKATQVAEDFEKGATDISLVEIGPRFVLTPIVILEGSFGGPVIYENREFVSPNQLRAEVRLQKAAKHARRRGDVVDRKSKRGALGLDKAKKRSGPLDNAVLFK
ncbi:putative ribosome biogenesis protein brx1 [Phaeomoniella chlamydospora]|uniref:Putative ribosome biogenesis protein brx1 n=1 Tax=Phaeomoniella chlamydospora TaxID=158046 RepID=A0A0G2GMN8_PHACM|nr:putative ribosome biogenesis protein brx1 [Phaeomoniella chlamydospora]